MEVELIDCKWGGFMIVIKRNKDKIEVYTDIVHREKCKSIGCATWDKFKSAWVYPEEALPLIAKVFEGEKINTNSDVVELLDSYKSRHDILLGLKSGTLEVPSHPFLMHHQRVVREIAKYYPRFAIFMDTGTGKTLTALQIMEDKAVKFLVLCPKANIKSAWMDDQNKFFPNMRLLPMSRNMNRADYEVLLEQWGIAIPHGRPRKNVLKRLLIDNAHAFVMNPEAFKSDLDDIKDLGIQGLVFDESTILKNSQSQICKDVTSFANNIEYVYILTGKPNPNSLIDYFSQMRIVDPCLLGSSFFSFKTQYFDQCGYMGYELRPKPDAAERIAERIAYKSIVISKEDCLDLPEKTYITRAVELSPDVRKYYNDMKKQQVLAINDDSINAVNKISQLMKLRQITSGFVMNIDGDPVRLSGKQDKMQELMNTLADIGDKPVIIWAQFKAEIEVIESALKKHSTVVTAYSGTKDLDASIKAFKEGEAQYMIAHPATLKFGVTFVNCTYAIYYSKSYNYEEYYQSHDRIYRKGQTKPCTFISLVAENTIDEIIEKALEQKGSASYVIEQLIKEG